MNSRLDENYDFSYLVPSTYQDIEEYVESKDFKEILRSILDSNILTTREFEVLKYRMGFYSDKIYTFEEIGQIFGVTRVRASQIEKSALKKLRNHFVWELHIGLHDGYQEGFDINNNEITVNSESLLFDYSKNNCVKKLKRF